MNDLKADALSIAVNKTPEAIELTWTGKSIDRQPAKILDPFFKTALAEAETAAAAIEMRFERLEHFNSSTLAALIALVQQAHGKGIKLVIRFDRALKWQRLSFDALRVLAKGDGLLEIKSV